MLLAWTRLKMPAHGFGRTLLLIGTFMSLDTSANGWSSGGHRTVWDCVQGGTASGSTIALPCSLAVQHLAASVRAQVLQRRTEALPHKV